MSSDGASTMALPTVSEGTILSVLYNAIFLVMFQVPELSTFPYLR